MSRKSGRLSDLGGWVINHVIIFYIFNNFSNCAILLYYFFNKSFKFLDYFRINIFKLFNFFIVFNLFFNLLIIFLILSPLNTTNSF